MTICTDYLIIGGGILGLTIARQIALRQPSASVLVIDKEPQLGFHASGRNSGVLHAGFYYTPNSQKAQFCVRGNQLLHQYLIDHSVSWRKVGKLVVPTCSSEQDTLYELYRRGQANGCDLKIISGSEAHLLEPRLSTDFDVLYSPRTDVADPKALITALASELDELQVTTMTSTQFLSVEEPSICRVKTPTGDHKISFSYAINACGCFSAEVARCFGVEHYYAIIPFKGLYLKSTIPQPQYVKHVYPVPDQRFPFLGIHTTITSDGYLKVGPTAIPAFGFENYKPYPEGTSPGQLAQIVELQLRMLLNNTNGFRDLAFREVKNYLKSSMLSAASSLYGSDISCIDGGYYWAQPGIRAQLVSKDSGQLIMDFKHISSSNSLHILNAISPAWTSSFALALYYLDMIPSVT